jgi:uncharacterized membrane protein YdjX (TVP38/TMEM64 family)
MTETRPGSAWRWVRLMALPALLLASVAAYFAFGLGDYLRFEALARNREWLVDQVARHAVVSALAFLAAYATMVALSLPGATLMTLTAGFLFGTVLGTVLAVTGATVGATLVFLIARGSFRELFRRRAGGYLAKLERGFQKDALSYLLFLRLVPLFPFWLVNLVPALLNVPLRIFVIGTFLGIIPGGLVYASVGNGLGALLDQGRQPDLGILFTPQILLPILGLAALALVPVIYKRIKGETMPGEKAHG